MEKPKAIVSSGAPDLRQMSLEELAHWAGERANYFRLEGYNCSEATLRAAAEGVHVELPGGLLRASTGFHGGGGNYRDRCGTLNSGALLVSYLYGRIEADEDATCASELTHALHERFEEELGATQCSTLRRVYRKFSPDESCAEIYAAGARLVVQLLGEAPHVCSACALLPQLKKLRKGKLIERGDTLEQEDDLLCRHTNGNEEGGRS